MRALEWAKEAGLITACNFMLGFPEDTPVDARAHRCASWSASRRWSIRSARWASWCRSPARRSTRTIHVRYGFTGWWLDEAYSRYSAFPPIEDRTAFNRYYIDDANLELDFFRYSEAMREVIRACLRFKGEHNLRRMGLLRDPVFDPEPVGA